MEQKEWAELGDGRKAYRYTFENKNGMRMCVSNFGALLLNVVVRDKDHAKRDVVLGYDTFEEYQRNTNTYFGAIVGRSANRTEGAAFRLKGKTFHMQANEGKNNLHSGPEGYQIRLWETEKLEENSVTFLLKSPDQDQGFPGNLTVKVTYSLSDENEVIIKYEGISDADTPFNLTNHSYFNLGGQDGGDVLSHQLMLCSKFYTPVRDSASIPTGEILRVKNTPMDFTKPKAIGRDIEADFEQLRFTGGYDHNFVLDKPKGEMGKFAEAYCPETGIKMTAYTDLPGVQFYAGNFLEGEKGKGGMVYGKRNGFCLETQYFPNAVNEPAFASGILRAGEKKCSQTSYRFETVSSFPEEEKDPQLVKKP